MSSKHSARQMDDTRPRSIEKAQAELQAGDYLLFAATPGLRLVAGKIARSWIHRYRRHDGRIVQVKVGPYPATSYAEAAVIVGENNKARHGGDDPAKARDEARKQQAREAAAAKAKAYTVGDMVRDYLNSPRAKGRSAKFSAEVERVIERNILPKFGKRSATDIKRSEAGAWLLGLPRSIARLCRAELDAAFEHAIDTAMIDEDAVPVWDRVKRSSGVRKHVRQGAPKTRYLTDAEIATLLRWLPGSGMSRTVQDALEFTLRLGMRSGEIVAAKWADVDLDRAQWTLPTSKTGKPRTIRLPAQVVAILRARRDLHPELVFARPDGRAPVRQHALAWALDKYRDGSRLAHFTPHDLRRSCRTGLSRIGCPGDVAEAALGHAKKGVVGTYDQHSFEAEVGVWLQRWNDHIDALADPAVVPFTRAAGAV
jgi:integrase